MAQLQLKGQKFGFWEVLEKDEQLSKEKHQSYWFCKCSLCEQISSVRGSALTGGHSKKCNNCNLHQVNTDETGNEYGKLKVLSFSRSKNNRKMWLCKCQCGNLIEVSTTDLRNGSVQTCGKCPERQSRGEQIIKEILIASRIPYIQEHTFDNFFYDNGYKPRYDFYIPSRKYIIEYDGKQHFEYQNSPKTWNTYEQVLKTQKQDKIKNYYCFDNNIPIIRIPYTKSLDEINIFDLIPETSNFLILKE